MNKWNIPGWLEIEVCKRDKRCVYCGVAFSMVTKKQTATWEHIVNDAKIISRKNIVLCCFSCNASKGTKELSNWFSSKYCKSRNITIETVADIIKKALINPPIRP